MDQRRRSQEPALVFPHFEDQSIHMVDLKRAVAAKGEIATIEMEGTKQPIADVSSDTTTLKAASR
jgi:hypothetical protein